VALANLTARVGPLPGVYLDALRQGNGGEVGLAVDPFKLCLDSAEAALTTGRAERVQCQGCSCSVVMAAVRYWLLR
jgi:hypothetical protein